MLSGVWVHIDDGGEAESVFFNDRPFLFGLSLFTTDSVTPSVGGG